MRKIVSLITVILLCWSVVSLAQAPVTGQVKDANGQPVPFASVKLRGSNTGVSADQNGNFSIQADRNNTLVISAAGFQDFEVSAARAASIALKPSNNLQEIVVTALGIRRQAKELGYSTARVSPAELNQGKVTNIATGLTGKVSGLQINTINNGINPSTRVTLRGNRSILGNNQALLVLDDVPLSISSLNSINPNDVESVTVLKGASASALYGSAASNGVIIVTTKKGTKGKPQIRFSNTTTLEKVSYLPNFQNGFGGFGGEAIGAPGTILFPENPFVPYAPYENQSFGPAFNGQKVNIGMPVRIFRPDGTFYDSTAYASYSGKPNAKKDFFNTGITVQNDISISTGDDKSRFFLSAQDVTQTGIIPKDKNHRNAFRINGSREVGKFRADYTIGYTLTHTNTTPGTGVNSTAGPFSGAATSPNSGVTLFGGATGGSYFQNRPVYWTVINTPPNFNLRDYKNWQTDPFANPNGYFNAYYGNPWWQIDQARLDEKNGDLLANLALNFKPTDWLNLLVRGGISRNDYNAKYTRPGFTFADWAIADVLGAGSIPSSVKKVDPQEGDAFYTGTRLTGDFLASFNKTYGNISVSVIGGGQVIDNNFRYAGISATSLVVPDFYNIGNRIGEPNVFEYRSQNRTLGAFGDATIGYKNVLFAHGSVRNDWVSILSPKNRSFLYPAADLSYVFSDAIPVFHDSKLLSYGKLRAAYSKTAQVSVGPYSLNNTFNPGGGFPFGNVAGFTLNSVFANADIKPEFTTEKEVGLEMGFLNNRIYFSAAYFDASTNNQTIPIAVSSTTGYFSAYVNSGEMSNKGVELDLKVTPLLQTKSGFRWDAGVNFSYIKNRVLSIASGLPFVNVGSNSYAVVGKSYPQIRGSDWVRDSASGSIIIDPLSGLPTPDPNLKSFGGTNPPLKLGLNTTFFYKGFTLTAVAEYRANAFIYNNLGSDLDFTGVSANSAQFGRQNFVIPNSVYLSNGKYVPNTSYTTRNGNNEFWASTWNKVASPYITSADFWKLREVSFSYEFPHRWFTAVPAIKSLNLGIVGRNLLMWRPKENIWTDPEFSNTNGNGIGTTDINQTPATRTFGASLSIVF